MRALKEQDTPPLASASHRRVAVLVPCYNEEAAIAQVVEQFRAAIPGATIHVYDNNSKDRTREVARAAGAVVGNETRQGKGHVVRRMFADVEADIYLLVDGDSTYDAPSAPKMIAKLIDENLDMVVSCRVETGHESYRRGHRFGNHLFTGFVAQVFGRAFHDILSGYRVFSRRFVKSFPALSTGFEIETELTVHALELGMPVGEVQTPYFARPEGSESKLNTWRDGVRILWTIFNLYRGERPLQFFALLASLFAVLSVVLALPVIVTYVEEGIVPRLPTAILAMGMMMLAFLSLASGLILDTVTRGRRELKRLAYLSHRAPYGFDRRVD
jgi:glycosyltransferase involved in cell wall biosynthesis